MPSQDQSLAARDRRPLVSLQGIQFCGPPSCWKGPQMQEASDTAQALDLREQPSAGPCNSQPTPVQLLQQKSGRIRLGRQNYAR